MNNIKNVLDIVSVQSQIEGASKAEVEHLQSYYRYKLPEAYIKFLFKMGKYANFLAGELCFIDNLPISLPGSYNIFIANKADFEITEQQMVFSSSQGTACWFFNLDEGEDPPVYFYMEGIEMDKPVKMTDSFSDYLLKKYRRDFAALYANVQEFLPKSEIKEPTVNDMEVDDDLPF